MNSIWFIYIAPVHDNLYQGTIQRKKIIPDLQSETAEHTAHTSSVNRGVVISITWLFKLPQAKILNCPKSMTPIAYVTFMIN